MSALFCLFLCSTSYPEKLGVYIPTFYKIRHIFRRIICISNVNYKLAYNLYWITEHCPFWTMSIMIFSPVTNFCDHPIGKKNLPKMKIHHKFIKKICQKYFSKNLSKNLSKNSSQKFVKKFVKKTKRNKRTLKR